MKHDIILIRDMVVERWKKRFGASNHTFHTKVYFKEFVANALRNNMGMVIFDLCCCGGC